MNIVRQPPISPSSNGHPSDDLDDLLRSFFRSEMPERLPKLAFPASLSRAVPPGRSLVRSRFALAASIALLLLGSWLVAGSFRDISPSTAPNTSGDSARRLFENPTKGKSSPEREKGKADRPAPPGPNPEERPKS